MQQILNVPTRQGKPGVEHHGQADDFRTCFEMAKLAAFCHPKKLRNRPIRLKRAYFGGAQWTNSVWDPQSAAAATRIESMSKELHRSFADRMGAEKIIGKHASVDYYVALQRNHGPMDKRPSIIVVEPDRDRAILIVDSLRDAGDYEIRVNSELTSLARQIQASQPDVVLIDVENLSRDTPEELAIASGPMDRPVAMFVDKSEEGLSYAAIEAGVSAYVVDRMQPQLVKPVQ